MSYELDIGHGQGGGALKGPVDLSSIDVHRRRAQRPQWMAMKTYLYMQPHYVQIMGMTNIKQYITRRFASVLTGDPATPQAFMCWIPKKSRDAGVVLPSIGETIELVDPVAHDLFPTASPVRTFTVTDAYYNPDYTVASLTLG